MVHKKILWYDIITGSLKVGDKKPGTDVNLYEEKTKQKLRKVVSLKAREFLGRILTGAFLCGVGMFSPCMHGLHEYSSFLALSKNMHASLIGDSTLTLRGERAWLFVSCGAVMDW